MHMLNLTEEEKQVAQRVQTYFKSDEMNFKEKLFNACLIAQHELDSHQFSNEYELRNIVHFKETVDKIMAKL